MQKTIKEISSECKVKQLHIFLLKLKICAVRYCQKYMQLEMITRDNRLVLKGSVVHCYMNRSNGI